MGEYIDKLSSNTTPPAVLPAVRLEDLTPATKDYLLSLHTATGRPIAELIRDILTGVAAMTTGGKAA
jgi:hypothetical protein